MLHLKERSLRLLARGEWSVDQVVIRQTASGKEDVVIEKSQQIAIELAWQELLARNPRAHAGDTVRLDSFRITDDGNLELCVLPSDYRQGMVLGWLGVAMIPVTSDGYVALQASVASIAATVGNGIRVPGCTPPNVNFFSHAAREMNEEFGVKVERCQLTVLGLVEVNPPAAKYHHGLIVRVSLKETFAELKAKWQTAVDRWEGEILPFQFTADNVRVLLNEGGRSYGPATPAALYLLAKAQFKGFE